MKKYFLLLTVAIMTTFLLSCEKEKDPPDPDFNATVLSSADNQIAISFTDLSSGNPDSWYWTFEGGTPSTSIEQNPTVTYSSSGTFDVSLVAYNNDGEKEIVLFDYVSIAQFNNPTWTDIDIIVNYTTKTIPVDGSVLFGQIDNSFMNYYAETLGETSTGGQIGLLIYWDTNNDPIDLTEYSSWNLIIDSYFVFINMKNDGLNDLSPIYVNWGDPDYETVDYITIANDGLWKATGYYDAWDDMEIRAFFANDQYTWVPWIEGSHFDLPWENNQGLYLLYDGSKSTIKSKVIVKESNTNSMPQVQSGVKR